MNIVGQLGKFEYRLNISISSLLNLQYVVVMCNVVM